MSRPHFPFSALLGQETLRLALLLLAVDPRIGGVLIQGPRGTAKSTSARAIADLLPGGSFVTLPLGATEEMLIGTLDIEAALQGGSIQFAPGLLAKADNGVLYVDEVNLLPDSLVDPLLDVSASGVNIVERDSISHEHPARFALIGTMNPDEGELRPQLLDRFGLSLTLENVTEPKLRAEIVRTRMAFDEHPAGFVERFADNQSQLRERIARARAWLPAVTVSDSARAHVSRLCVDAQVEGMRADLVMLRAARAFAAWHAEESVSVEHVDAVADLALHHRRRTRSAQSAHQPPLTSPPSLPSAGADASGASWGDLPPPPLAAIPTRAIDAPAQKKKPLSREPGQPHTRSGPQWCVPQSPAPHGAEGSHRIHWPRTLAAMARCELRGAAALDIGSSRATALPDKPVLQRGHLRFRRMHASAGALHCFLVDCSSSMSLARQLATAKGLLMQLIHSAYQQRAEVAIIGFAGAGAKVHLPATPARPLTSQHLEKWLQPIRAAGATPFTQGVTAAAGLLTRAQRVRPAQSRWLWLLTDGRTSESPERPACADIAIVIDCEQQRVRLNRCAAIAHRWSAHYRRLADYTLDPNRETSP